MLLLFHVSYLELNTWVTCELSLKTERLCLHRFSVSAHPIHAKLGYNRTCVGVEREEPSCNGAKLRGISVCFLQTQEQPNSEWRTERGSTSKYIWKLLTVENSMIIQFNGFAPELLFNIFQVLFEMLAHLYQGHFIMVVACSLSSCKQMRYHKRKIWINYVQCKSKEWNAGSVTKLGREAITQRINEPW